MLIFKYHEQTLGRSLVTDIRNGILNEELRYALSLSLQYMRPGPLFRLNGVLVQRDVSEITTLLKSHDTAGLFNILLCRSDPHILAIAMSYGMADLDREIEKSSSIANYAKKILLHALRTSYNPAYRDAVLLHETMGGHSALGTGNDQKLSIRVCRMRWDRNTWHRTKREYRDITGKDFLRKMSHRSSGTFRNLMVAMASL